MTFLFAFLKVLNFFEAKTLFGVMVARIGGHTEFNKINFHRLYDFSVPMFYVFAFLNFV